MCRTVQECTLNDETEMCTFKLRSIDIYKYGCLKKFCNICRPFSGQASLRKAAHSLKTSTINVLTEWQQIGQVFLFVLLWFFGGYVREKMRDVLILRTLHLHPHDTDIFLTLSDLPGMFSIYSVYWCGRMSSSQRKWISSWEWPPPHPKKKKQQNPLKSFRISRLWLPSN